MCQHRPKRPARPLPGYTPAPQVPGQLSLRMHRTFSPMATSPDVPIHGALRWAHWSQAAEALEKLTKETLGTLMVSALKFCFRKKVILFFLSQHQHPSAFFFFFLSSLREGSLVSSMR